MQIRVMTPRQAKVQLMLGDYSVMSETLQINQRFMLSSAAGIRSTGMNDLWILTSSLHELSSLFTEQST